MSSTLPTYVYLLATVYTAQLTASLEINFANEVAHWSETVNGDSWSVSTALGALLGGSVVHGLAQNENYIETASSEELKEMVDIVAAAAGSKVQRKLGLHDSKLLVLVAAATARQLLHCNVSSLDYEKLTEAALTIVGMASKFHTTANWLDPACISSKVPRVRVLPPRYEDVMLDYDRYFSTVLRYFHRLDPSLRALLTVKEVCLKPGHRSVRFVEKLWLNQKGERRTSLESAAFGAVLGVEVAKFVSQQSEVSTDHCTTCADLFESVTGLVRNITTNYSHHVSIAATKVALYFILNNWELLQVSSFHVLHDMALGSVGQLHCTVHNRLPQRNTNAIDLDRELFLQWKGEVNYNFLSTNTTSARVGRVLRTMSTVRKQKLPNHIVPFLISSPTRSSGRCKTKQMKTMRKTTDGEEAIGVDSSIYQNMQSKENEGDEEAAESRENKLEQDNPFEPEEWIPINDEACSKEGERVPVRGSFIEGTETIEDDGRLEETNDNEGVMPEPEEWFTRDEPPGVLSRYDDGVLATLAAVSGAHAASIAARLGVVTTSAMMPFQNFTQHNIYPYIKDINERFIAKLSTMLRIDLRAGFYVLNAAFKNTKKLLQASGRGFNTKQLLQLSLKYAGLLETFPEMKNLPRGERPLTKHTLQLWTLPAANAEQLLDERVSAYVTEHIPALINHLLALFRTKSPDLTLYTLDKLSRLQLDIESPQDIAADLHAPPQPDVKLQGTWPHPVLSPLPSVTCPEHFLCSGSPNSTMSYTCPSDEPWCLLPQGMTCPGNINCPVLIQRQNVSINCPFDEDCPARPVTCPGSPECPDQTTVCPGSPSCPLTVPCPSPLCPHSFFKSSQTFLPCPQHPLCSSLTSSNLVVCIDDTHCMVKADYLGEVIAETGRQLVEVLHDRPTVRIASVAVSTGSAANGTAATSLSTSITVGGNKNDTNDTNSISLDLTQPEDNTTKATPDDTPRPRDNGSASTSMSLSMDIEKGNDPKVATAMATSARGVRKDDLTTSDSAPLEQQLDQASKQQQDFDISYSTTADGDKRSAQVSVSS